MIALLSLLLFQSVDTLTAYTGDGYAIKSGTVWATVRGATTADSVQSASTTLLAAGAKISTTYWIRRTGISFPPETNAAGQVIDSAFVQVVISAAQGSLMLTNGYYADSSAMATSDIDELLGSALKSNDSTAATGTFKFYLTAAALTALSTSGACNKFAINERGDFRNATPALNNTFTFSSANAVSDKPILVVYYHASKPTTAQRLRHGFWFLNGIFTGAVMP